MNSNVFLAKKQVNQSILFNEAVLADNKEQIDQSESNIPHTQAASMIHDDDSREHGHDRETEHREGLMSRLRAKSHCERKVISVTVLYYTLLTFGLYGVPLSVIYGRKQCMVTFD